MKKILFLLSFAAIMSGCKEKMPSPSGGDFSGLKITEVAPNAEKGRTDSWVEICNSTSGDINLTGLDLYISDSTSDGEVLTIMDDMTIRAGERLVFSTADYSLIRGFSSADDFELVLGKSATEGIVDRFSRSNQGKGQPTVRFGSYQRIPESGDEWVVSTHATKRIRNYEAKPNGIWVWSSHMDQWIADDFKVLKELKQKGYDHILLNYNSFDDAAKAPKARQIIAEAKKVDMKVHAWMQVFRENNTWVNPIENLGNGYGRYKQEEFDRIIAKANWYIDEFDVDGIHLDYVRFSGVGANLANSNNYLDGVTAVGAITEFCKQLRESIDSRLEGVVISAAMMPESGTYYYGQDAYLMGQYIDILMPMAYRYYANKTNTEAWFKGVCNSFANTTTAQVWPGVQTYKHKPNSEDVVGMDAAGVLADAQAVKDTPCTGIVYFRFALGEFPDVNDFWE